jgi:hypothetical protein
MSVGRTATASANRSTRPPPWRDLRWITAGVLVAFLAMVLRGLFGPEPPIVVSRSTTFITEPLPADGLPDYVAALREAYGPPPPTEENAAVPLVMVHRDLIAEHLGSASVAVMLESLGTRASDPGQDGGPALRADDAGIVLERILDQRVRPVTPPTEPELAAIDRSAAALDRLVEASRLPVYWCPGVAGLPRTTSRDGPRLSSLSFTLEDAVEFGGLILLQRAVARANAGRFSSRMESDWQAAWAMQRGWLAIGKAIALAVSREARSIHVADEFLNQRYFEGPRALEQAVEEAREGLAKARDAAELPSAAE